MTKEEAIKTVLQLDVDEYNIPTLFANKLHHAFNRLSEELMTPSLPSNLDEAAEENSKNYYCSCLENHNETGICDGCENVKLAFKAGAEWMAGQVMMLKWKYPKEKYQYPECLTRIMDEYGDWHYTISEGHLNPDCEYISLAELSLRLATRL